MTQLALAYMAPEQATKAPRRLRTIAQRFEEFHVENPHVFDELLRLARARVVRGERRIGVKALWEELRQSLRVQKVGEYALDNSFTAIYARLLIEVEPALGGVIELRRRKAA